MGCAGRPGLRIHDIGLRLRRYSDGGFLEFGPDVHFKASTDASFYTSSA